MTNPKPYDIPKRMVLEAYRRVRAKRGAAGIDGESLEMFEAKLTGNLYKLWNRMWVPRSQGVAQKARSSAPC